MELREQIARAIAKRGEWETSSWLAEAEDVLEVICPIIEERDKLRAQIEEMKNQEAVGQAVLFGEDLKEIAWKKGKMPPVGAKLYLAPGAQPAAIPEGWSLVLRQITEQMHVAACKEIVRSDGLDGLPQRMLDAMLAAAPNPGDKP